jgi:Zn-finger nucleic acid-binding protein
MKCPKCGYDLVTGTFEDIEIDQCTNCHGIWFDQGEAESLVRRDERGPVGSVLRHLLGGLGGRTQSS